MFVVELALAQCYVLVAHLVQTVVLQQVVR